MAIRKINKIFLIILPVLIIAAAVVLELSVKKADKLEAVSGCGCDTKLADGSFDPSEKTAFFMDKGVVPLLAALPEKTDTSVLGETSSDQKWIEIDLSEQKLIAWEGDQMFLESLVSSGKWGKTPTGEFTIWSKFRYTKMSGGNKALHTYYYLPNVPYTMYFYKDFGLHGTYWHNDYGRPRSNGCVNLPSAAAKWIYRWTNPVVPPNVDYVHLPGQGTRVQVV